jgi:hypothetical protein
MCVGVTVSGVSPPRAMRGACSPWRHRTLIGSTSCNCNAPIHVNILINWHIPTSSIMDLGFTQPLTEISNRNLHGSKARPAGATFETRLSIKCGILHGSQSYGPARTVSGPSLILFMCWLALSTNFIHYRFLDPVDLITRERKKWPFR